ncbi:MAG TPA: glutathione S-transferase family protein [Xanthomonadales bacterium]|nr:glutathione S-transferase family protein [Xanthomonadales bacterium]
MLTLHGDHRSGNCYKIELALAQLGLDYRFVAVDVLRGQSRTPEFLAKNANGKIPLLELDDGRCLPESNAILCYLADGSALWPSERFARAQVLQWLFFEQYSHEPYIATARFIVQYLGRPPERAADLAAKMAPGHRALAVMEQQLSSQPFLCGDDYTIADIALYAYTHVADEGDFDLGGYPAIGAWLQRVREQPGHVAMVMNRRLG